MYADGQKTYVNKAKNRKQAVTEHANSERNTRNTLIARFIEQKGDYTDGQKIYVYKSETESSCYRTCALRKKNMQHTKAVCGTERDHRQWKALEAFGLFPLGQKQGEGCHRPNCRVQSRPLQLSNYSPKPNLYAHERRAHLSDKRVKGRIGGVLGSWLKKTRIHRCGVSQHPEKVYKVD
jgi:hypothetical protein